MRLPLLAPGYNCASFNYTDGSAGEPGEWLELFHSALATFVAHASSDETVAMDARQAAASCFQQEFETILAMLDANPSSEVPGHAAQPLSCLSLCQIRERCLTSAGFKDIFKAVKDKENTQALLHMCRVLQELDSHSDAACRWRLALAGVFAGNIFDLGAASSAALFEQQGASASFTSTRAALLPRPWAVDDLEEMLARLCPPDVSFDPPGGRGSPGPYVKVLMLVDNAGSDVVLGMLPLAREFVKTGSQVILAANEGPSCNDITVQELGTVLAAAAQLDDVIRRAMGSGQLRVVSTGNRLPVIDLEDVSEELVGECDGVDLIILEGMGRAIETNLHAAFICDSWKLGMIKHLPVAKYLGGRLYDCVCKFSAATV